MKVPRAEIVKTTRGSLLAACKLDSMCSDIGVEIGDILDRVFNFDASFIAKMADIEKSSESYKEMFLNDFFNSAVSDSELINTHKIVGYIECNVSELLENIRTPDIELCEFVENKLGEALGFSVSKCENSITQRIKNRHVKTFIKLLDGKVNEVKLFADYTNKDISNSEFEHTYF